MGNVNVLRGYETQITESNCSIYFVLISPIWSTVSSSVYHTSGKQKTDMLEQVVKGLETKAYEEQLKLLDMFRLQKRTLWQ